MVSHMTEVRNVCVQTIHLEQLGTCTYTLTEEDTPVYGSSYRITVTLDSGVYRQTESVRDVTTIYPFAMRLFWKICRGHVTPTTLRDVISDLLSE